MTGNACMLGSPRVPTLLRASRVMAAELGMQYGSSLLLDLIKAFDSVPFDWRVKQTLKFGYIL